MSAIREMLNRDKLIYFPLLLLFLIASCNNVVKTDKENNSIIKNTPEEIEEAKANLTSEKKIDMFTFSAIYKPWDYIIAMENKGKIGKAELEKKKEEINDLQYYTFKIKYNEDKIEMLMAGLSSKEEYYARIQYFSFAMQNDLKLIDGEDTLDCALFHFERTYGLASEATFSLGFPLTKQEQEQKRDNPEVMNNSKTLIYDDKALGVGKVYVKIDQKKLNNIPEIKTQ